MDEYGQHLPDLWGGFRQACLALTPPQPELLLHVEQSQPATAVAISLQVAGMAGCQLLGHHLGWLEHVGHAIQSCRCPLPAGGERLAHAVKVPGLDRLANCCLPEQLCC